MERRSEIRLKAYRERSLYYLERTQRALVKKRKRRSDLYWKLSLVYFNLWKREIEKPT